MTSRTTTKNLLFAGVIGIVFSMNGACADTSDDEQTGDAEPPASVEGPEPMSREERLAMRQKLQEARQIEKVPQEDLQPTTGGVIGEVPDDLLEKILADLEKRTGAQRSEVKILKAEARQWNDGALGCPEPGQAYTQAIVNGYQVIIEYNGKSFDYHASESSYFVLCTGFRPNRQENPTM